MAGKKGQKKRYCSDDEKRSIYRQTLAPEVSVAQVARRNSLNSNLIIKWFRAPRFAPPQGESSEGEDDGALFLPVELAGANIDHDLEMAGSAAPATSLVAQRLDIILLLKIIWWDAQEACLFSKGLERGRFVWPAANEGKVSPSPSHLSMLLEGIHWRMPRSGPTGPGRGATGGECERRPG